MSCARENCPCEVSAGREYRHEGKVYCCEKCARECTDERCVCSSDCGCPKTEA